MGTGGAASTRTGLTAAEHGAVPGWRRVIVPAQRRYMTRGTQHQSKHLVMSGSAPVPEGGEDALKGWGRSLFPSPGSLPGPCLW